MSIIQSNKIVNGVSLKTPPLQDPIRTTTKELPEKITVACVFWGNKYSVEYVIKLKNMLDRHMPISFNFICLTDRKEKIREDIENIPIVIPNKACEGLNSYGDTKGWWAKINLFQPGLFSNRVLYLDLDVVVVSSLKNLLSSQDNFCMIENFGPNKHHAAHNSSVMLWTPSEETDKIYTKFSTEITEELHGDQCWIWRVMKEKIFNYPKSWVVSYKYEKLLGWSFADENTCICVFHGNPKPHQVSDSIIVNNWK